MRKVVLFIAASLDGFIAAEDGSLKWLDAVTGEGDNGFSAFYQRIDTILMGRRSYDHLLSLVDEFPHADRRCYVFSHVRTGSDQYVTFVNEDAGALVDRLRQQPGSDIWLVGGGSLLATFLEQNLVDEFILTIAPVLLGRGVPLFPKACGGPISLQFSGSRQYGQFVQLHYVRP